MSKYDNAFIAAVEDRKRQICVDLLRDNPQTTLAEIRQLSRGELGKVLAAITIGDLMNAGRAALPAVPPEKPKAGPKKKKPAKSAGKPARGRPRAGKATSEKAEKATKAIEAADKADKADQTVNTRTPSGRASFDGQVYEALKAIGDYAGAGDLQDRVGGTNMQVRSAVNRLIAEGKVTWTGKARGTRYRLA